MARKKLDQVIGRQILWRKKIGKNKMAEKLRKEMADKLQQFRINSKEK